MDMPMPESSGSGGGNLTNQLMGIFRERSRAQKQLELAAYGSAMNVASEVASEQLKGDVRREGLIKDFQAIYEKHPEGHAQAGQYVNPKLVQHVEEAGMELTPSGAKFSPSSLTKLELMRKGLGPFEQYKAPTAGATTSTGPEKPQGRKGKGTPKVTPTVNDQPQVLTPPNVGNRAPRPSKGGYTQPAMFTKAGNVTKAAAPVKKARAPRAPRAGSSNLGLGQTPNTPSSGGM